VEGNRFSKIFHICVLGILGKLIICEWMVGKAWISAEFLCDLESWRNFAELIFADNVKQLDKKTFCEIYFLKDKALNFA